MSEEQDTPETITPVPLEESPFELPPLDVEERSGHPSHRETHDGD